MPEPLKAGIAPGLELHSGYIVRFTALDPTTGATVGGVVVSNATIQAEISTGGNGNGNLDLTVPLFTYGG